MLCFPQVPSGVCFVKLDLHEFSLDPGPDQSCHHNWFSVIGANGGGQVVPSLCGQRRGQSCRLFIVIEYEWLINAIKMYLCNYEVMHFH